MVPDGSSGRPRFCTAIRSFSEVSCRWVGRGRHGRTLAPRRLRYDSGFRSGNVLTDSKRVGTLSPVGVADGTDGACRSTSPFDRSVIPPFYGGRLPPPRRREPRQAGHHSRAMNRCVVARRALPHTKAASSKPRCHASTSEIRLPLRSAFRGIGSRCHHCHAVRDRQAGSVGNRASERDQQVGARGGEEKACVSAV